jgi:hypothetical protein
MSMETIADKMSKLDKEFGECCQKFQTDLGRIQSKATDLANQIGVLAGSVQKQATLSIPHSARPRPVPVEDADTKAS